MIRTSLDWGSLESTIPPHLWSPQFGSHGLVHNWIHFSIQYDVFSVPTSVTLSTVSKALEAALDDKDIQQSLTRTNTTSNPLQLQRYAMYVHHVPCGNLLLIYIHSLIFLIIIGHCHSNEKEKIKRRGRRSKTSSSDSEDSDSIYRGVTK